MDLFGDPKEALDGRTARWAKEEGSGVAWCGQEAALLQALEAGERRLELAEITQEALSRCVAEICRVLPLGRIDQLSFVHCGLSETHLGELANALPGSRLQALGIAAARDLPPGAWCGLWETLPLTITKLDFGENHFSDAILADLCGALSKQQRDELEELFLDENHFTTVAPLIEILPAFPELSWLDVGDNQLDDEAIFRLCDALPSTKLSCLVLGTNNITGTGASRLFATLPSVPSMEMLYLDNTGTDDAALAMLGTFIQDVPLKELHLDSTQITERGVRDLCALLARSSIDFLDVSDNNLSDATVALVKEVLGIDDIAVEDGEEIVDDDEPMGEDVNGTQPMSGEVNGTQPMSGEVNGKGPKEGRGTQPMSGEVNGTGPKEGRGSGSQAKGKGGKKGKGQGKGGYSGDGGSGSMDAVEE